MRAGSGSASSQGTPGTTLHRHSSGRQRVLVTKLFLIWGDTDSPVSGCSKPQDEKQLLFLQCQFGLKISRAGTFFYIKMNINIMRRREQNSHEFLSVDGRQTLKTLQLAEGGFLQCLLTPSASRKILGKVWEAPNGSLVGK